MRANLVAVPDCGLHDLPPRWDGKPVAWRGWQALEVIVCPPVKEACESCGSLNCPTINVGIVGDDQGMTPEEVERDDRLVRAGYKPGRTRKSWIRLSAFRCPDCGADSVLDSDGVLWTLDLSDYGDSGSEEVPTDG